MATNIEPQPSLVVTLPYQYCNDCTDMLKRWCEPMRPFDNGWFNIYSHGSSYRTTPDSYIRDAKDDKLPVWMSYIGDLKARFQNCRGCNFLLETLQASPWTGPNVYNDDDFVVVRSQLVGSRHLQIPNMLATPGEREDYDRQFEYGNRPRIPYSKYDRYHRPMLRLYRKIDREDLDGKGYGTHMAENPTFILPLEKPPTNFSYDNMFHGRLVRERVDMSFLREWFRICVAKHFDCLPTPRRQIPHFRLIDVQRRCVVLIQKPIVENIQDSGLADAYESQPEDDGYQYAALSYVWGRAKRLLLTAENLDRLSTPGALSSNKDEVPQTFKDALSLASHLNIPYVWIDAVCVQQDNESQLVDHMTAMDSIYSSAVLTIVSDGESADSGIPGISGTPRGPPQATLKHGSQTYISARRTFGAALLDSHWESRAWCLQEKLFSKRLMVFASSQVFFHCSSTTWFEDTIMEIPRPDRKDQQKAKSPKITIAERESPYSKGRLRVGHTAYEAHAKLFGRNFWSLIETYTRRQLSFESDAIRAFSGILQSMKEEYGPSHSGVPEYHFSRGMTWSARPHRMSCRRPDGMFPSWSWANWRGNGTTERTVSNIHFGNVLEDAEDLWNLDFHIYRADTGTAKYVLTPMRRSYKQRRYWVAGNGDEPDIRRPKHEAGPKKTRPALSSVAHSQADTSNTTAGLNTPAAPVDPNQFFSAWTETTTGPAGNWREQHELFKGRRYISGWGLPGHPGEEDYVPIETENFPPFDHDASAMPPLSQIIRFYTSVATVELDDKPDEQQMQWHYAPWNIDDGTAFYAFRSPFAEKRVVGHVQLDKTWREEVVKGKKEFEMVYISLSFWPPTDSGGFGRSTILWVLLVEDYNTRPSCETPGDGEKMTEPGDKGAEGARRSVMSGRTLKKRVQLAGPLDIETWRLAKPRWECVALA